MGQSSQPFGLRLSEGLGGCDRSEETMEDSELYGNECPGIRGDTRAPRFGELMRGVWAGKDNPHRDGMFVRTVRKTGRMNPGTWHELTDGKGKFWQYEAKSTVFLTPNV